jgi:glucosamine-6-phosphate deaminase
MWATFFGRIDPELRPPPEQIHFLTSRDIATYGEEIAALGGADVCYGGIGWCGYIAFWESHLGH